MCTLILATRAWSDAPLVVASNRDERLPRPSSPPALREWGDRLVLAPLDEEAGGTWLGLNDRGGFAGITNRFVQRSDPHRNSRGSLVRMALEAPDLDAAVARIVAEDAAAYNGFHLVLADRRRAQCIWSDGRELTSIECEPGVHGVTERSFGAAPSERLVRWEARARRLGEGSEPSRESWEEWLGEHATSPIEGSCVHWEERGYGTRSSFLLRAGRDGIWAGFREGPACGG